MKVAALLSMALAAVSFNSSAQIVARPRLGANTRTGLPNSRHRFTGAGNPAGSKLAKKAVKGTITIRQGW